MDRCICRRRRGSLWKEILDISGQREREYEDNILDFWLRRGYKSDERWNDLREKFGGISFGCGHV